MHAFTYSAHPTCCAVGLATLDILEREGLIEEAGRKGKKLLGGLQQLVPLFEPVYDALVEGSQEQTLWHADETRWLVFASVEGKVGYRWYLWVFYAAEAVVFVLASIPLIARMGREAATSRGGDWSEALRGLLARVGIGSAA